MFNPVKFSGFKGNDSGAREAESRFDLTKRLAASDSFDGEGAARFLDAVTVGNACRHDCEGKAGLASLSMRKRFDNFDGSGYAMRQMNASELARELGKLGKGKKKTMSKAAIAQRRSAAKRKRIRTAHNNLSKSQNNS
jgi:hypothetical protein